MLNPINEKFFRLIHPECVQKGSGLNTRCPICGDSKKNDRKARFWLFNKGSNYDSIKCFNCDYSSSMRKYIADYHPQYLQDYNRETLLYSGSISLTPDLSFLNKQEKVQNIKIVNEHKHFLGITSLIETHRQYLISRCVPENFISVFRSSLGYVETPERIYNLNNFIIYPIFSENEIYPVSFYSRSVEKKEFFHYTKTGYNKYYKLIQNPNNKDIFVFEGLFDALTSGVDNFVVLFGASFPFTPPIGESSNYIWCFDNDETGKLKTKLKTDAGERVCLIKNFSNLKDINDIVIKNKYTPIQMREILYDNVFDGIKAKMLIRM